MAFPRKSRDQIRKSAGVSLPTVTIERLDALAGGAGKRSAFLEELIIVGLEQRFGTDWIDLADLRRHRERQGVAA